jgi:hypothetical protein
MYFKVKKLFFKNALHHNTEHTCLFGSVVVVAFQSVFRVEMHQNDIFLVFKNYF